MKSIIVIAFLSLTLSVDAQKFVTRDDISIENGIYLVKATHSPFTGKVATLFPNEQVEGLTYVKRGKRTGKEITFYDSGKKKVLSYEDDNFNNYGHVKVWDENGSLTFKGKWFNGKLYKKGEDVPFTGTITCNYKNGGVYETVEFRDGLWHGKQIRRDRNGNIIFECIYRNNKIVDCPVYNKR